MTEKSMKTIIVLFVLTSVVTMAVLGSLVYIMVGYIEEKDDTYQKVSDIYSILQGYEIKDIYIDNTK